MESTVYREQIADFLHLLQFLPLKSSNLAWSALQIKHASEMPSVSDLERERGRLRSALPAGGSFLRRTGALGHPRW